MDSVRTYRELVGGDVGEHYARKDFEPACSGVVLYLGLKRATITCFTTISCSRAIRRRSSTPSTAGRAAPDPTCYLAAPPAPNPTSRRTAARRSTFSSTRLTCARTTTGRGCFPAYRQVILDKLKRTAGMEDIEEPHRRRAPLTPQDIHDRYKVLNGAIYGLASHGSSSARSSRATAAGRCAASISPAARPIPGRACRWS